jgi:hypothetical protein
MACDPVSWSSGTFELLHRAGPSTKDKGERLCARCGDPAPIGLEEGDDYLLTDANHVDESGRSSHTWSAGVNPTFSTITATPCDGSGGRGRPHRRRLSAALDPKQH